MNPEQFQRVRKLFDRCLQLDPAEREAFLADACADDPEVRAEVEKLLGADATSGSLVETAISQPGARPPSPPVRPASPGTPAGTVPGPIPERIGPYRIVRVLGEGGMGIVYEAEQTEPVRRTVALKIIKVGLDSGQVLARFESERQALALMDHPNIARILDAGADEHGRPYFAMEHIRGVSITEYCDLHNLSTRERLDLLIQACDGIQHAHRKGIIHRDIKPSNILVEIREGRPVPRIIDFGVAKATDRHLTERTLFTEFGQIIGTPEYMSPEQAEMTGLDIDTRTDVYSLGVILYELLVGELPFDPRELRRAGYSEMRRRIREETPAKPSTRISTLGRRSGEVARHRRADPNTLARTCRGDLDWITMRALEKDRTRRYGSATELSDDLKRYLNFQPVSAGPPSVTYRARKFVRRHRLGVGVAALLAAAFVLGFAGTAYGLVRAVKAERATRLEAETARAVGDFMVEIFDVNDPRESRGRTVTAKEVLDRGAGRIRSELSDQPAFQGRLMESMGMAYRSLGLYDDALPLLQNAVETKSKAMGPNHPETARASTTLAGLLLLRGRPTDAIPILEKALAIQDAKLEEFDPEKARTLNNLGSAYRMLKRYREALPYLERALAIREKALSPGHRDVARQLASLGSAQLMLDDFAAAKASFDRALAIQERIYGPDHPDVAKTLDNLATMYRRTQDFGKARETLHRVLAIEEKTLGKDHPGLINTLLNLGRVERLSGNREAAIAYLRRALEIGEARLPAGHPDLGKTASELAAALREAGREEEARGVEARLSGTPRP